MLSRSAEEDDVIADLKAQLSAIAEALDRAAETGARLGNNAAQDAPALPAANDLQQDSAPAS